MKNDLIGRTFSRIGTAFFSMACVALVMTLLMMAAPFTYVAILLTVILFYICAMIFTLFLALLNDSFRQSFVNITEALAGERAEATINIILAGIPIAGGISIALFAFAFIFLMIDYRYKSSLVKAIISSVFLLISIIALVIYEVVAGQF